MVEKSNGGREKPRPSKGLGFLFPNTTFLPLKYWVYLIYLFTNLLLGLRKAHLTSHFPGKGGKGERR